MNCPLVKIHNETCLLFSKYILLLYISHFLCIISYRHLKRTADKCTCAWEFKKPFFFCFIMLHCIQAKINEQFVISYVKLQINAEISCFILPHEKLLQSDWLRAVVFQLNFKYLHVKITNLLRVVV